MQVFFIDSSRNGITLGLSANRKYSGTQAVMGGQTSGCPVIRSSLEAIAKATRENRCVFTVTIGMIQESRVTRQHLPP